MGLVWVLPILAIIAVWWPSLPASFQFDDWNVIVNDPRVHSLAAWWDSMPGIRPLLKLSYALNYGLDDQPQGFRAANILIHALNAALVYWLLRARGHANGLDLANARRAAVFAALLFALHPVQTEAVTYISGRSSSLAACFCLLSLACWVHSEQASSNTRLWLTASCVSFIAAAATKETALVLPLALWLWSADRPVRETLKRLSPLLVLSAVLLVAALSLPTYRHLLQVSLDTRSLGENLLTQARAITYLAGQLLRIGNTNADPQLPVISHPDLLSVTLGLAWLAVLVTALLRIRKSPIGAFATLWLLLWLAPTNSLLPRLDVANDRQLYLALIGPAWWLAMKLTARRTNGAWIGHGIAAVMLILLTHATLQRNRVYATEVTFWQDTAARNPMSSRAANNLGMAYALDCQPDAATEEFERAISLDPQDYRARINLRLLGQNELPGVDADRCAEARGE